MSLIKDLKKLVPIFSVKDRKHFAILLCLIMFVSVLEAAGVAAIPIYVTLLIKPSTLSNNEMISSIPLNLPDSPSIELVLWASSALIIFLILKLIVLSFVYYTQSKVITSKSVELRHRLFKSYMRAPYEWHLQHSSAELQRNIQEDAYIILNSVIMPLLDIVMGVMIVVMIICVLVLSTPGLALFGTMVMGLGVIIIVHTFRNRLVRYGGVMRFEGKTMIQSIQQGFGALIDARIMGCEKNFTDIYKKSAQLQGNASNKKDVLQKITPGAVEVVSVFGLLTIIIVLFQTGEDLDTILPLMSLLAVTTIRLKQIASKIAVSINAISVGRVAIPDIISHINEFEQPEIAESNFLANRKIRNFNSLTLNNVTFAYAGTKEKAVINISLQIQKGESIAFVGSTGCGKSTLVKLILGLLTPASGCINVNGESIHLSLRSWRDCLGYVPQDIFLIDDTIIANVAFGVRDQDVNIQYLKGVLKAVQLDEFVESLEDGLNTVVGERGVRMSGGQRQRLGIARAIYFNPKVLILDEATSALDNKTELDLMAAIKELCSDCTIIAIAHRLRTVERSDRLYFLDHGVIECEGSYQDIIDSSPKFRIMALK